MLYGRGGNIILPGEKPDRIFLRGGHDSERFDILQRLSR